MSRIGYQTIRIPDGVVVTLENNRITAKGPNGAQELKLVPGIEVKIEDKTLSVTRKSNHKQARAYHGMTRALIFNLITGVSTGFSKKLEIRGVGYKASLEGDRLSLSVGFSHPVFVKQPEGIIFKVEKNTITVSGGNKQLVGEIAARIRNIKKPEPYKGKGIRYDGEVVHKKAGKTSKTAGAL